MDAIASFLNHHPKISMIGRLFLSLFIVVGPTLGYIPQYKKISNSQSVGAFSLWICLILLISQSLRILFWIGNHYEIPLLLQSVAMITVQIVLLELCIHVRSTTSHAAQERRSYFRDFWNWENYSDYIEFIAQFILANTILTLFMVFYVQSQWYIDFLGYIALLIEATLGIPQLIQNYQLQSTKGFR
jgi:hypothetical protein